MGAPDNRRRHPRVDRVALVQVSRFDEAGFRADLAAGRTLNISHGGIRLELYHPLPLRSVVELGLVLGEQLLEVQGRVTYLEALDEQRTVMGIEFLDLSEEQAGILDRFVAEGAAEGG